MARIENHGKIRGTVGAVNYRILGKQLIMQSNPGRGMVKQSLSTKHCSADFGFASNRAKIIRNLLYPAIKGYHDAGMVNRFNAALSAVVRSIKPRTAGSPGLEGADFNLLDHFEFNTQLPFDKAMMVPVAFTRDNQQFRLSIDAFVPAGQLCFPAPSSSCALAVLATAIDFQGHQYGYLGQAKQEITQGEVMTAPFQFMFSEKVPAGSLIIVTLGLTYYAETGLESMPVNSRMMNPVKILSAYVVKENEGPQGQVEEIEGSEKWFTIPDRIL